MTSNTWSAIAMVLMASSTPFALGQTEQEDKLEEVIVVGQLSRYSALKSDIPIMETARSVSVEDLQQLIDKGVLALDDAYTYTAGVTGETYGFATRGDWVRVRGLDVPQYQDSLQSLFGNYNNTRPDVYTLEQVEILKGPASVLFGKGSPGGIVNVVSKRPREESRHELMLEYGNNERAQIAVDSTGTIAGNNEWLYRMVALYRDAETQVDEVDDQTLVFAPSVTWRPSDLTNITMLLNYTDVDSDTAAQFLHISGTLTAAPNGRKIDTSNYLGDPNFNKYEAETTAITLLADHQFNETWSGEFTARYTDAEADYQQALPSFIGGDRYVYNLDGSLYKDGSVPRSWYRSDATSEQAAIDGRLRASFSTGDLDHNLLIGAQYQDVETDDDGYYAFALGYGFLPGEPNTPFGDAYWINVFDPQYGNIPPKEYLDALYADGPETTSEDYGVYINNQISWGDWRITLGARYDETKTDAGEGRQEDDEVSFAAGVLYQFDNGLAPYVSYAESFEPFIGDNGNGQPLDPLEGEQWEVGIKYQPDNFPAFITLAYFEIEQSNMLDPLSNPNEFEQQSGTAEVDGVEMEAYVTWNDLSLELNASHLDTESPDGFQLDSVPEDQASAWLGWRPTNELMGFKAGIGYRYVGSSYGGLDVIKTPSYDLWDFMLGYEQGHWDVTLNVRNAADDEYLATCIARGDCFPGDERQVVGRVRYIF